WLSGHQGHGEWQIGEANIGTLAPGFTGRFLSSAVERAAITDYSELDSYVMNVVNDHPEEQAPVSYRGARRIVGLVLLLLVIWMVLHALQSVVLLFAVVFLLAAVLNPAVVWLEKRRVPRVAAVAIVMLALIAVVATIVVFAIPPLATQVQGLIRNAPTTWENIRSR